ncbi:hypothetical protein [Nitrospira sp. Kam-Ns4a]
MRRGLRLARSFQNNLPHALRECGLLAAIRGRPRRALKHLNESLAVAERQGARYEYAQTLLARGQVGCTLGWPGASDDLAAAERLLRELRAGLDDEGSPAARSAHTLSLADRFATIQEVGCRIAAALSPDAVFAAVKEGALKLLRGQRCLVLTMERTADTDEDRLARTDEPDAAYSQTLVRRALDLRRPVVVPEGLSPDATDSVVLAGVRSVLYAPILVRGRPTACF